MFNKMKDVTPPKGTPPAQPMISGGMAMMLKSMGLEPAQFENVVTSMLKDVSDMSDRVAVIEKRLDVINEVCAEIQAAQGEILVLLRAALKGRASDE